MWIPRWLGEAYSKLYIKLDEELFTFKEARDVLAFGENKLAVAWSKLHSRRILTIFESTRPRQYRLLDPKNFILLASEKIRNIDQIVQERYVKVLCDAFHIAYNSFNIESFAVYGSVARGSAQKNSDIDILIISDYFEGSLGSRITKLYKVEEELQKELKWLRNRNIYTGLSFYPMRREEAEKLPTILLDLTEEAVILYDKDRLLEKILAEMKAKILKLGAKKVIIGKGNWYWDLKPDYKFGEEIQI